MIERFVEWAGLPHGAASLLANWEAVPLVIRDEVAGIGIVNGTEIHFALAPAYRNKGIQRTRCRVYFAPLLERRGYLTTRVYGDDQKAMRFIERLGFQRTWTEGPISHYMLSGLPFSEEN